MLSHSNNISGLNEVFDNVKNMTRSAIASDTFTSNLVDSRFFENLRGLNSKPNVEIFFGNHLNKVKLVVNDEQSREHHIVLEYCSADKIKVIETSLPYDRFQDTEYACLDSLNEVFFSYISQLQNYLNQLDELSNKCVIVDPIRPTYRDVYRKIVIGEGVWLHIEVNKKGEATNIHLIGGDDAQREKLDRGLLKWDHDLMIYQNIMSIFGLESFPDAGPSSTSRAEPAPPLECAICLCFELADSAPPAPLCANPKCGLHFHRSCLYQWLVMTAHKQPHQFAARGSCPNCGAVVSVQPHD